jgi:hypothetical protein
MIVDTSVMNISESRAMQNEKYRQLSEGLEKGNRIPLANKYVNSNLNHIRKSYCGSSIKRKFVEVM